MSGIMIAADILDRAKQPSTIMLTAVADQQKQGITQPYRRLFIRDCLAAAQQANDVYSWGAPAFEFKNVRYAGHVG